MREIITPHDESLENLKIHSLSRRRNRLGVKRICNLLDNKIDGPELFKFNT